MISAMEQKLVKHHMMGAVYLLLIASCTQSYPVADQEGGHAEPAGWRHENNKRTDIFMSRGWGAEGMPFNVLYTQNFKGSRATAPKVVAPLASMSFSDANSYLTEPQALRSLRQEPVPYKYASTRRQYSVIPQLFVSYGWGPLGKK